MDPRLTALVSLVVLLVCVLLGASAFIEKHQPAADLLGSVVAIGILRMRGEEAPVLHGPSSHPEVVAPSAASARPHP